MVQSGGGGNSSKISRVSPAPSTIDIAPTEDLDRELAREKRRLERAKREQEREETKAKRDEADKLKREQSAIQEAARQEEMQATAERKIIEEADRKQRLLQSRLDAEAIREKKRQEYESSPEGIERQAQRYREREERKRDLDHAKKGIRKIQDDSASALEQYTIKKEQLERKIAEEVENAEAILKKYKEEEDSSSGGKKMKKSRKQRKSRKMRKQRKSKRVSY